MSDFPAWTSNKALEFKADSLIALSGPGVYMYLNGDRAIYIGSSNCLGSRAFRKTHHQREAIKTATGLILFPCASLNEAKQLEKQLIADLLPTYNGTNAGRTELFMRRLGIKQAHALKLAKALECAQPISN